MGTAKHDGWTMRREMQYLIYYSQQLAEAWQGKLVFGTAFAGVVGILEHTAVIQAREIMVLFPIFNNGDPVLGLLLVTMMCLDLAIGLSRSLYKREFNIKDLGKGICKYPLYFVYVFLVAAMDMSINRPLGTDFPILNLFLGYMSASETCSIIRNLHRLGLNPPPLLMVIVEGGRDKVEAAIKNGLSAKKDKPDKKAEESANLNSNLKIDLIDALQKVFNTILKIDQEVI